MNELTKVCVSEYQSYLLRIWRPCSTVSWRIILEQIQTGERRVFTTVHELYRYLEEMTVSESGSVRQWEAEVQDLAL